MSRMIDETLRTSLAGSFDSLFECEIRAAGDIAVWTSLLYPDGDVVSVFVHEDGGQFLVTDYGEALGWLWQRSGSDRTPREWKMINSITSGLGVRMQRGCIEQRCAGADELADAVHRVAQAAARVADIWYAITPQFDRTLVDDIDDWLELRPYSVKKQAKRVLRSGREQTFTYQIEANSRTSLVILFCSETPQQTLRVAEYVADQSDDLHDLIADEPRLSLISLVDDARGAWTPKLVDLLSTFSEPVRWFDPDTFDRLLAAAPHRPSLVT